jgi:serine/threonine protein phosphatase PrpC
MASGAMTPVEAFGLTDVGRKRKHNEDAYALDVSEGLFIVADGMGGHAAGEVAAKITVETIGEFIAATRQKEEATWPFRYDHQLQFNSNRLAIAIEKANERVMAAVAAQPWLKGMGTTVVAGLINEKTLSLAHVGDSRAYLLRDGSFDQVTTDHTVVGELVRRGRLTPAQAAVHPERSILTRAVGLDPRIPVDTPDPIDLRPGDQVLLCSDGLTEAVPDPRIGEILATSPDGNAVCASLIATANDAGGPDNITVVLLRVE